MKIKLILNHPSIRQLVAAADDCHNTISPRRFTLLFLSGTTFTARNMKRSSVSGDRSTKERRVRAESGVISVSNVIS